MSNSSEIVDPKDAGSYRNALAARNKSGRLFVPDFAGYADRTTGEGYDKQVSMRELWDARWRQANINAERLGFEPGTPAYDRAVSYLTSRGHENHKDWRANGESRRVRSLKGSPVENMEMSPETERGLIDAGNLQVRRAPTAGANRQIVV